MSTVEGILWDNDGVLVDTEHFFYRANRDLFARLDFDLTEQHFFDWYLTDNCGAWHLFPSLDAQQIQTLRTERDRMYADYLRRHQDLAIDGMGALLDDLSRQVAMGVVTSSNAEHFDLIHARLDFLRHFKFVVTNEMVADSKPSPEPYLLGLEKIGLPASRCLVIEDSPRGLQAAKAAGIRCIVLRNRMMSDCSFEGAYRVVDSVVALRHEIQTLLRS